MEKKNFKRTLVTAALPYANGGVHIGHLAGVYVPSDIYVRYLRLRHRDVLFVCGSDEHGVPITLRAKKEGVSPQDICDRYHNLIKQSFADFGISFDIYSRTTSDVHARTATEFFKTLYDKGAFVEQESEQYYDEEAHTFLADRYIKGECPHCGNPDAYGDQCERCGKDLSPTELLHPHSTISGSKPVLRRTKHWYLPLDKAQPWLEQWILREHPEWRPNVLGQCKSWFDMGLKPRAVTRDLDWGIPVPVSGAEGKVLYVWFDAPIGYISNTRELLPDTWQTWWKSPDTRLIHFIGKDNIVFHCIVFPAMLRAEGSYILPDNVPANEFLNLEDNKISTSRNWAVWLDEYLRDFPGKQDVLRYVLTANAPETKDNNFTWRDFQARNNNELVAVYGNFVNRALVLTWKYYDGRVPTPDALTPADEAILAEFRRIKAEVERLIEGFRFRDAQKEAMNLARIGNKYLADAEPWKLQKTDPTRVRTILYLALQLVANLSIAFEPFLPFSSERLRHMLGGINPQWDDLGRTDLLTPGHQLGKAELLFEKIADEAVDAQVAKLEATRLLTPYPPSPRRQVDAQVAKLEATRQANEQADAPATTEPGKAAEAKDADATPDAPAPALPEVGIDTFRRLDLRVGTVVECERVPKADKLLRFLIDDGQGKRQILSGIAAQYDPADLVGRRVVFLANLPVRRLRGFESQGMLLTAEDPGGKLALLTPDSPVAPGSTVS